MLGEVADDHVSARAGDARPAHGVGVEGFGQPLVEALQSVEGLEDLPIARRIGGPPRDDVRPVCAVLPRGAEELLAGLQGVADSVG